MPPIDPKISRYIDQAARIEEQKKRKTDREAAKHRPKPHSPINTESARAYRAMYPRKPTIAWWYGWFCAMILYGFSWLGELFPYDREISIALMAGLILWGFFRRFIMPSVWAGINRGWRTGLPFLLKGWDDLLADSRLLNQKNWRDLTITITTARQTPELKTALEAAMMLFKKKAHDTYYGAADNAPTRLHWKTSAFSAEGSGNNRVFGLLVEFFRGTLSRIERAYDADLVVTITSTKDYYFVPSEKFSFPDIVP